MMETSAKKSRSRFSKLLRDMHPYNDLKVGAPMPGTQTNGESGTGTASKKKKSSSKHRKSSKYDSSKY